MKGLLVKDIRLMLAQKFSVAVMPVLAVILLLQQEEVSFVVGYMVLLGAIFCMSTITYDVMNNGMAHLMTLPIKRKTYVYEKYVFIIGTAAVLGVLTVIVGMVINGWGMVEFKELGSAYLLTIAAAALMMSVMLPVQLKFGPEKSRIVIIFMFAMIGAAISAFSGFYGSNEQLQKILDSVMSMSDSQLGIVAPLVVLGLVIISIVISVRIIENKEY